MTAIHTTMSDGRALCLRPLKPSDSPLIEAGIIALSDRSRYLRFFSGFKTAPQTVIDRLTDLDDDHLAWGAVDASLDNMPAIAAAHIVRTDAHAETSGDFAVAVLDDYHNLGVARALTACLFADARDKGFLSVTLDVLAENAEGRAFFKWLGSRAVGRSSHVIHLELDLAKALHKLGLVKRTR